MDGLEMVLEDWLDEHVPPEGDPMTAIIDSGPWRYVRPDRWMARLRSHGRGVDADADADTILTRQDGATRRCRQ